MSVTPQTNVTLGEVAEFLRRHDDFVLCGHVSPDGDCLGSQLALAHALEKLGKRVSCVLARDEPVSAELSFMPGCEQMVPAARFNGDARTFVGLDVPSRERVADAVSILDACEASLTIDHHAAEATMCDFVYVDPDAASASTIVWDVVKLLVDEPPFESALCAYVGLVTDTGGFRFQNSDECAFKIAGELVASGVNPADVAARVFQNRTMPSLKLEALVIERMETFCDGSAVISWVGKSDMERYGASKNDAEPLIDAIRSLEGTRVACMLREQDGAVRGSLRSKDATDISVLARKLGGGGHKSASGFTLDVPLDEALELMKTEIAALLASDSV